MQQLHRCTEQSQQGPDMSQLRVLSGVSPLPLNPHLLPSAARVAHGCCNAVSLASCLSERRFGPIGGLLGGRPYGGAYAGSEGRRGRRRSGVVGAAQVFNPQTLHWVSAISSVILLLTRDVGIKKSLLAPLFALQAPTAVISWIKSEYGMWTAFLALLVRLFYPLPGEVELPLATMLIAALSPTHSTSLRGTPAAAIISLALAAYLAYQHFSKTANVQEAFTSRPMLPITLSLLGILLPPVLLLFLY